MEIIVKSLLTEVGDFANRRRNSGVAERADESSWNGYISKFEVVQK
jgi:hypothetical protein